MGRPVTAVTHRHDEFHRGQVPTGQIADGADTAGFTPMSNGDGTVTWSPAHSLASAPGSPVEGQTYYDTVYHMIRTWDGLAWQDHWTPNRSATAAVTGVGSLTNTATNP
jgi:hypothetical protein